MTVKVLLNGIYPALNACGGAKEETALHLAASHESPNIAKVLLEMGADVNCVSEKSKTPLHIATCHGRLELVKLFKSYGADFESAGHNGIPILSAAIYAGHDDVALWLVKNGAPLHARRQHFTPVFVAAWKNRPLVLRALFDEHVNLNIVSDTGTTLLHCLANHGLDEYIEKCISAGIGPNVTNERGWTPLHFAASNGHRHQQKFCLSEVHI